MSAYDPAQRADEAYRESYARVTLAREVPGAGCPNAAALPTGAPGPT